MAYKPVFETIADDARAQIQDQGFSPDTLDVGLVLLGTNDPDHVERAAYAYRNLPDDRAFMQEIRDRYPDNGVFENYFGDRKDVLDAEVNDEDMALASQVVATADRIRLSGRRRARVRAFLVSAGVGISVLLYPAYLQAQDTDEAEHEGYELPAGTPKRIHDSFALVADETILPGDAEVNIPVIGTVLEHIPGVPDYEPLPYVVRSERQTTEVVESTEITASYSNQQVLNPVAPDLELTGVEYRQARTAAQEFIGQIPDGANIAELSVEGLVSDEFNCEFGETNPEQQRLITARTDIAAQAFFDEASLQGVDLPETVLSPEDISKSGREVVLTNTEQAILYTLLGDIALCDALQQHNSHTLEPGALKDFLDTEIGNNRGAIFTGTVEALTTVTKEVPVTKTTERPAIFAFEGEYLSLGYAGLALVWSLSFGVGRSRRRFIRSQAKKQLAQSGFKA